MIDASYVKVTAIEPAYTHPGGGKEPELMERLEQATVGGGWKIMVPKGIYKPGQDVFYIRPDAVITKRAAWATEETRRYLGKGGRVKSIRIQGNMSEGMIVSDDVLPADTKEHLDDVCEYLGIAHYTPPVPTDLSAKCCFLPPNVVKSDEENFQNLSDEDKHYGEPVLITRKMDGSSCTIYANAVTGETAVCSRSMQLKLECSNNFTKAGVPLIDAAMFLSKHYGEPVALRGEVCGQGIQSFGVNKDSRGEPQFFMYGVHFPDNCDPDIRKGRWGSGRHFTDINEVLKENGKQPIQTVPILGELPAITEEYLQSVVAWEPIRGEGIVVNGKTFSYKAKSAAYYAKIK